MDTRGQLGVLGGDLAPEPTLANLRTIFFDIHRAGDMLIVSSITILSILPVAIVAGYAFSRFRFGGGDLLLVWVLAT